MGFLRKKRTMKNAIDEIKVEIVLKTKIMLNAHFNEKIHGKIAFEE